MSKIDLKKGELAEEKLRLYFLSLGYFVVRSVNASYKGFDVTDVDLFLYSRPSPISRERTNVDVKMKQRPQALERVFWTKGLRDVLGLEKCVVATTDKRSHIGEFGAKNDVLVLDGNFMNKLDSSERYSIERLNEEEFILQLENYSVGELGGNWKKDYEEAKSNILSKLNFDGVNYLLNNIHNILEEICAGHTHETCYRALYIYVSFFLINLDYSIKNFSYKDQRDRVKLISNGIRFGEMGQKKSEEIIAMSSALMKSFMSKEDYDIGAIENEVLNQFMSIPSDGLAEFLGSTKSMLRLFPIAIELEKQAFSKNIMQPSAMPTELQSIIGLLCDFYSLDRKKVLI
ncbi:hypothetical protein OTK59_02190 [Vibrio natriegens]|uniref:hypothetical protein n=1 Tax=Vibrio natriegens TaxID=691 RepID=UPI002284CAA4|nr:hypothetical protein [Vibrio natriegens]ELA9308254.1 hypothetical protein [Vibrio parahaemolyticus]MCY9875365.1 hypothetical protein [Vibrio natriegens]